MTFESFEAVTVKESDDPAVIELDFAAIETVGAWPETVIVVSADELPLELVAVAVYVVVEAGVTVIVPPEYGRL